MKRTPLRGEIWYVQLPTDPPGKAPRPVVVVSMDARNRHPGACTVLIAPLSGSVQKDFATHIRISPGETGLHTSNIRCEDLTVVKKDFLIEPKFPLRALSNTRVCEIAEKVRIAMGCPARSSV